MFRTIVLTFLCLFVTVASPFSWDIVIGGDRQLYFYYNGNLTHTEGCPVSQITSVTYDPAQYRVLFSDAKESSLSVLGFDLTNRTIQTLFTKKTPASTYARVVYDPVTQLMFWTEDYHIYTFSLNPASSNKAGDGHLLISLNTYCSDLDVDSCGGYIYWATSDNIERARLDGSKRKVVLYSPAYFRISLAVDQQTQRIYWIDRQCNDGCQSSIESSTFNGKNKTTLYIDEITSTVGSLAVSKDFIYWQYLNERGTWQLPKNSSDHVARKLDTVTELKSLGYQRIAANYTIQEQIQGLKSCKALQGLIPNNSKPESTVSICQNYCLEGNCSVNAEGQPTCRCKTGYSGKRCEVNTCQSYCLNGGVCSLNEQDQPVCRCSEGYEGSRCEFPVYLIKCIQAVSMLRDVLSADVPPVALSTSVQSTCASNVV